MSFLLTYIDVRTVKFPACWILIGQFKFPARQLYARNMLYKTSIGQMKRFKVPRIQYLHDVCPIYDSLLYPYQCSYHPWFWVSVLWLIDSCQNKLSAGQYHLTISREVFFWLQLFNSSSLYLFILYSYNRVCLFFDFERFSREMTAHEKETFHEFSDILKD